MKKTHKQFLKQVENRNFRVLGGYENCRTKIKLRCDIDNHEWYATPDNLLKGRGCPKCAGKCGNDILEDNGDWLLIDISTPKFPNATMAVDTDVWEKYKGGRVGATKGSCKYIYASCFSNKKQGLFHSNLMDKCDGEEIDHVVHGMVSFVDNRKSNLRVVTRSQNKMNQSVRIDSTSGVSGVSWYNRGEKWVAYINIDGKHNHLGYFNTIIDAVAKRYRSEREVFGEYSYINNN